MNTLEEEDQYSSPMDMYILSHDALRGTPTDQSIPPGWSSRPSKQTGFFSSGKKVTNKDLYLKILKQGVPPALRCAVWTTNVQMAIKDGEDESIGTLRKVPIVEHGWKIALQQVFPDQTDEDDLQIPDLGLGSRYLVNLLLCDHGGSIPEQGALALKRVLYVVQQLLIVEYCPMLPDLTALLLSIMEESLAYTTLRSMLEYSCSVEYVAVSPVQHIAWCATFCDVMKKLYPQTHAVMVEINMLTPQALDPIFKRLFVTILPRHHVMRIFDLYSFHGVETLFRFGTALMCLFHAHMNEEQQDHTITNPTSWWEGIRNYCHTSEKWLDPFLQEMVYGGTAGRFTNRSRSNFPRWELVKRWIAENEEWAKQQNLGPSAKEEDERPLGFVDNKEIVLVRHASERQLLAHWFPTPLKATKLELIYSTNVHGRTVERFYHHVAHVVYSITIMEILDKEHTLLGMFASQTWHKNVKGYGNGECFVFRLRPNSVCFPFQPTSGNDAGQIMRSGEDFISMGIAKDGSSGLRLNEDFTKGTTSPLNKSFGNGILYENEVFDIGLVEVYRLVREVDGRPIDSFDTTLL